MLPLTCRASATRRTAAAARKNKRKTATLQDFGHVVYGVRNAVSGAARVERREWRHLHSLSLIPTVQDVLEFMHEDFPERELMAAPKPRKLSMPPKTPSTAKRPRKAAEGEAAEGAGEEGAEGAEGADEEGAQVRDAAGGGATPPLR